MASYKEHCKDCREQLGKDWNVVHLWLDEIAKDYWPWMGHRLHRHHKAGVEEVRQKWGDEAAKAAKIHILKDEGKIMSREDMEKKYGVDKSPKKEMGKGQGLDL